MTGTVTDTYVAAIQHDLVDLDGVTRVGVARQPPPWFHGAVDENVRDLGPPEPLLGEVQKRREDFKMAGMCETGAHNAAWEETDFEARYRSYLEDDEAAKGALSALQARIREGEDIALVCFEADDKRCHRHVLCDVLSDAV
jgi:uncharacterized protein YeaO (DUF488 family)